MASEATSPPDQAALRRGLRDAIALFERYITREEARRCLCGGACLPALQAEGRAA